jgi:hypothetical protein
MNLQPIWQALQDPAWVAVALTALALIAAGINFLLIKPIRNWRAQERGERQVVLNLVYFLYNRRAVYSEIDKPPDLRLVEHRRAIINSVQQIRNRLGEVIERLDEDSNASLHVRNMQAECRRFLSRAEELRSTTDFEDPIANHEIASEFGAALKHMQYEIAMRDLYRLSQIYDFEGYALAGIADRDPIDPMYDPSEST